MSIYNFTEKRNNKVAVFHLKSGNWSIILFENDKPRGLLKHAFKNQANAQKMCNKILAAKKINTTNWSKRS